MTDCTCGQVPHGSWCPALASARERYAGPVRTEPPTVAKQPSMFDEPETPAPTAPYQPHSTPSRASADAIAPKAGTYRQKVYRTLLNAPDGLTDEQMQTMLHMNPSTQRPRRIELVNAGLAYDSGRTRTTRSGRQATVWLAHPQG